jgi:hypothetical protein
MSADDMNIFILYALFCFYLYNIELAILWTCVYCLLILNVDGCCLKRMRRFLLVTTRELERSAREHSARALIQHAHFDHRIDASSPSPVNISTANGALEWRIKQCVTRCNAVSGNAEQCSTHDASAALHLSSAALPIAALQYQQRYITRRRRYEG